MRSKLLFAVLCLGLCAAGWTQQVITREGHPALRFEGTGKLATKVPGMAVVVDLVERNGAPAFRFPVTHSHAGFGAHYRCRGVLYVGRSTVAYDPIYSDDPKYKADALELPFTEVAPQIGAVHTKSGGRNYYFFLLPERGGQFEQEEYKVDSFESAAAGDFLRLAVSNFQDALDKFQRLTAQAPVESARPTLTTLQVQTNPGGAQVYLDEQFRGTSSDEGRLIVSSVPPGEHHLRLTLLGYKEWKQAVALAPGEEKTVQGKLESAGPKPLALSEIEEALANGLPPKGITKLVNQYGVDFALTKEVEQHLRSKGADDALLVAIATGKK